MYIPNRSNQVLITNPKDVKFDFATIPWNVTLNDDPSYFDVVFLHNSPLTFDNIIGGVGFIECDISEYNDAGLEVVCDANVYLYHSVSKILVSQYQSINGKVMFTNLNSDSLYDIKVVPLIGTYQSKYASNIIPTIDKTTPLSITILSEIDLIQSGGQYGMVFRVNNVLGDLVVNLDNTLTLSVTNVKDNVYKIAGLVGSGPKLNFKINISDQRGSDIIFFVKEYDLNVI